MNQVSILLPSFLSQERASRTGDDQLVVDSAHYSNVARFINHSCAPSLIAQPVFANDASTPLLYYIALFASEDIPALTELTLSYGESMKHVTKGKCCCGSAVCVSTLAV